MTTTTSNLRQAADQHPTVTAVREFLTGLTTAAIKELAREVGAPVSGTKATLVQATAWQVVFSRPWRVQDEQTVTPGTVATEVISEDDRTWRVRCEGAGCTRMIDVAKVMHRPVDYRDQPDLHVKITATAPAARRCAACGPFSR